MLRGKTKELWKVKLDGLVKSQEFVILSISHLMISIGYEAVFLKLWLFTNASDLKYRNYGSMSIIWINKILRFVSEWYFCGILKVFARKPNITEPEILWDNQRYWNQWIYCRYHMDTCNVSHFCIWCQIMVQKIGGFWWIKRANSSAWIHPINLWFKSSIAGVFRTDI